jgi:hypothetical protein
LEKGLLSFCFADGEMRLGGWRRARLSVVDDCPGWLLPCLFFMTAAHLGPAAGSQPMLGGGEEKEGRKEERKE